MSELIILWSIAIASIASVILQINEYKRRKRLNAAIKELQKVLEGKQK